MNPGSKRSFTPDGTFRCRRCDVECVLQPMHEGSKMMGWYCPCCRSTTRTAEMIEADGIARAKERGITVEELREESRQFINPDPLSPEALEQMRQFAQQRADEWEAVCEHDTENPWLPETAHS